MPISNLPRSRFLLLYFCLCLIAAAARAQAPESRVVERVNEGSLVTLRGNTHPLAQPQFDRGAAPPDLPMERMLLVLKRSDAQESALQSLLDAQHDPNSPGYHQWLTPEQFGRQFGPSDQDIQAVATWLQSHGFQVARISRGRTAIEFSGTAAQVQQAFRTEIRKYAVNGVQHWANSGDPQIPVALSPVIVGVNSLHNFLKTPAHRVGGIFSKSRLTGEVKSLQPGFTFPNANFCGPTNCYYLGPYDFAKIYNVTPLWNASPAIDGTGQSIANIGRSDIVLQDVRDFRNLFGLPPNDPNFIVDGTDPGFVPGDQTEATLDVEWSGAVAKGATINLVISASTETADGVDLSALYAVDNNTAPVINESFLQCELFLGTAGNAFQDALREQASAQGITFITAAGDQGAAGCDFGSGNPPEPAAHGLMVNGLSSSPHGVAVGGTDFLNFGPNMTTSSLNLPSPYWSATNDTHQASALGYIPESTWNSTCTNNVFAVVGLGVTPEASCNNAQLSNLVDTEAGGGGKSNCITSDGATPASCSGGYPKPSWQSAPGVPADGARDIPDVSLFASPGFMNSAYIVCEADQTQSRGTCGLTNFEYDFVALGGTSASAPAFAGIMAMVNQYTQSAGQGNANYILYKMASSSTQTGASCNSSTIPAGACIFHDITSGTIATPCAAASLNCILSSASDTYGVLSGYKAGTGYDLATGLGSVNAYNLVHGWVSPGIPTTTTLSLNNGQPVNITHGASVGFSIAISPSTASGVVSLVGSPTGGKPIAMGEFTLQNGSVSGTTTSLAGGTSYQVKAHYAGDGTHAPSDSVSVTVTVAPEASATLITFPVFDPNTGNETGDVPASVVYGSQYSLRVDVGNANAKVTFPMKPVCVPVACPTGSVTLTDSLNGGAPAPLSGSATFPLNSLGYTEDPTIQLLGGMHQISASYTGDHSYSAGSGTYALTVTPALTYQTPPILPNQVIAGTQAYIFTDVSSSVYTGAAPTGTVSFYDGTSPMTGTATLTGQAGVFTVGANLHVMFATTFSTNGTHQITAKYSGDANYAASTSSAASTTILYPTTTTVTASSTNINLGQSVTFTATATTTYKNPQLTGTFRFMGDPAFPSTVTPTLTTDASGNQVLTASVTITPQSSDFAQVTYSGDANFEETNATAFVNVNIPDFGIAANSPNLTIAAGQTGATTVAITPLSTMPSTVALSCNLMSIVGVSCTFNPVSPVALSNGAAASTTLSISTLPPSSQPTTQFLVMRRRANRQSPPPGWWLSAFAGAIAILLLSLSSSHSIHRLATRLSMIFLLTLVLGCGATGGAGNGGTGGGGFGLTPTSLTLSTSALKAPYGANLTFTVNVKSLNSSQPATGTANLWDSSVSSSAGLAASYVANGVATFQISYLSIGTHVISAQYYGDGQNQPSKTSGSINVVITGTAPVFVQGATSILTHSIPINVTIQ